MLEINDENIDRYVNHQLTESERIDFENQLESDSDLAERVKLYKEVEEALSRRINMSEGEQVLRKQLGDRRNEYFGEQAIVRKMATPVRKIWWRGAVSVAAAAIIILLVWQPWQQSLLTRFGQESMTLPTVRGSGESGMLTRAARLFNAKDFQAALPVFDSILLAHPDDAQPRFYRGVAYIHLHDGASARGDLQAIFHGHSVYKYKAAYFTALSFAEDGQKDSSRVWLQKIPIDAGIHADAEALLKKIGR